MSAFSMQIRLNPVSVVHIYAADLKASCVRGSFSSWWNTVFSCLLLSSDQPTTDPIDFQI
jgi:hypothetical protein